MTTSDRKQAKMIATRIVEAKLAACVNIVGPIRSLYRWDRRICDEPEVLLVAKTRKTLLRELERMVKRLHSYENPEVIALPIIGGARAYLKWLRAETQNS